MAIKKKKKKNRKKEISASETPIITEAAILDDFNIPDTFSKFPMNLTVPPVEKDVSAK